MNLGWRRLYPAPVRFVARRVPAAEYLDDPRLDPAHRAASYRDLARLDRLPWQFAPLAAAVDRLAGSAPSGTRLSILELGAGTGHTGRRLAARLARRGRAVTLLLTDRDPEFLGPEDAGPVASSVVAADAPAIPASTGSGAARPDIRTGRLDWLIDPLPACDIVVANLVLHHFPDVEAVTALRRAAGAARLGGAIYDLDRNAVAFHALRLAFPLWAESPVTVADALLSVQQAFTVGELRRLAIEAALPAPRATNHGLFRNLLAWERPR